MSRTLPKDLSDDTREKLLEAAGRVFADMGFRAATVRDICATAGVNIAAVNYHFGDKLGLYTEVLERSSRPELQAEIRTAISRCKTPEAALRVFVRSMFEKIYADDHPDWHMKIMVQEMANPTPALSSVIDHVIRPQYNQLSELIGNVIGRGPQHVATRRCVHSLIAQITHYAHARPVISHLSPDLQMTPAERHDIADHVVRFTLAGLAAATPVKRRRSGT